MATKYNKVKQAIKSSILDGTFQPHQKINSESELMKQFDVSRHTVRLAIGDLVTQGWLYRKQGAGTFCSEKTDETIQQVGLNQKNIAIVATYISDYIFPSIIRGAESYLSKQGYHVSLFSTNNDHEIEKKVLEKILTQQYDGVIVEPTKSAVHNPNINYYLNLERLNIPYIMINAYYDELEPLSIVVDDEKGGYLQTEHLIELGHTNIVGIFKSDDIQGSKRMKGYVKAHRHHQVAIKPNNIITYDSKEKATKPVNDLYNILTNSIEVPTAIVCYNDELAIKLLDVLREKNLQVPEDISVVGYDDSFLANVSEVKLTTVDHPKSDMGIKAAEVILELIHQQQGERQNKRDKVTSVVFDPKLVIRSSTQSVSNKIVNQELLFE
ncbi:GntR family transcriptional regulator [Litchfieldia salsa]|uniref:Transcriptional regulator, GntR family n=1 Tax=Litchfieldia salsa TaxID=930152 RepID=A0A1H0VX06_9BACI|nr:GntR family transcriptional regulator [Litchfieldia salsa]SDP82738.1 transcriptional regulator, GntR family [Litchfieldia salsa]